MKFLLEYGDVKMKNKDVDDEMLCIEKILKFYKSEFDDRRDLYTQYLYKLFDIHYKSKNYRYSICTYCFFKILFSEAAFTLLEHANRLSWSHKTMLDGNYPEHAIEKALDDLNEGEQIEWDFHSEGQLKQELYTNIINLFEKGKMWEEAINCCKELEKIYEESLIDFPKLSEYLFIRARLTAKIIGKVPDKLQANDADCIRSDPSYFFVGFFGIGFDDNLSNKMFIYRGSEYERLDDFSGRLIGKI